MFGRMRGILTIFYMTEIRERRVHLQSIFKNGDRTPFGQVDEYNNDWQNAINRGWVIKIEGGDNYELTELGQTYLDKKKHGIDDESPDQDAPNTTMLGKMANRRERRRKAVSEERARDPELFAAREDFLNLLQVRGIQLRRNQVEVERNGDKKLKVRF